MEACPKNEPKIEKPEIKEGVDFVFHQNPSLSEIGTKENYLEYIETIFPESKVQDLVYHETNGTWFKNETFSKEKLGKTDDGYYGKGFYFSTKEGISGGYGEHTFLSKLNIKNPKYNMDTHTVGKQILLGQNKTESKKLATTWLLEQIGFYKNESNKLEEGEIVKHHDLPAGANFEVYWENERLVRIDRYSKIVSEYKEQLENIDSLVEEYYSYDGFLTSSDTSNYEEILVREPDQIHILGSENDSEGFKKFIENRTNLEL